MDGAIPNIDENTDDFYSRLLIEADKEWKEKTEEEKKRYNLEAKKSNQTGQDLYFFEKVNKKTKEKVNGKK